MLSTARSSRLSGPSSRRTGTGYRNASFFWASQRPDGNLTEAGSFLLLWHSPQTLPQTVLDMPKIIDVRSDLRSPWEQVSLAEYSFLPETVGFLSDENDVNKAGTR
jgi:hypothetical protein